MGRERDGREGEKKYGIEQKIAKIESL